MMLKLLTKKNAGNYFYLVSAIFFVVIISASALFLVNEYFNYKSTATREIKTQNNVIKRKISDSLFYTTQIMSYAGKQIANHDAEDYPFINKLMNNYRNPRSIDLYWNIFAWADTDQKLKVSSGIGVLEDAIDLSDRDYLALSRESPETMQIGLPVIGKLSKVKIIPIGYGVLNSHREYVGSIIAGLVIDNIESEINQILSDENILFAVVASNGDVVMKSVQLENKKNKKIFDKTVEDIRKNPRLELTSDFVYYQQLYRCEELDCPNYGIITFYDNSTTSYRSLHHTITYLMIASFAISIAGFILFGFYEHIIHPIVILSGAAQKIRHGHQQNHHLPKFEISELNQIAKSLKEIDKELWNKKIR